ncbi:MAG TPA: acyl-CoA dehydrogenase [Spirochaetota bacterium]|nr:acyl-CoA dehydrogenase [Spirochaetota bacterium]
MKNPLIDTRDQKFVLFEVLGIDSLTQYEKFSQFDHDTFEATLDLIENICVNQCYPHFADADREGCSFDAGTGEVKLPESVKKPLRAYYDAGFIGMNESPEIGGMGLPQSIGAAGMEFISAAHQPLLMYGALAHGSMKLIAKFGTEYLKKTFVQRMMRGEWGGTMCLTEPQAGSDVGRLAAKAVKQPDGTYRITGQKIFISAGENDFYSNIIHPVLARIEGDPEGTKGISIFIVPKFLADENGNPGKRNDVKCIGIEHKMGIKGCVTCTMSFGDDGNCVGYLLGNEREGMKIMFNMMNDFRMGTASQAQGVSSAAYLHAASYAKGRMQGTALKDMNNPSAAMVPIVEHPDVKRMLLWMKSYVDGQRMLVYSMYYNMDLAKVLTGDAQKEAAGIVDFLVPICKAGCSDRNTLITSEAMQVFGGYGFCSDYPIEQMMRNSKILCIFEGANGIQGIDLVMRKILMNPGQFNYGVFKKRILASVNDARKSGVDDKYIAPVERGVARLDEYVETMKAWTGKFMFGQVLSGATPFRKAIYMLAIAWMHVWSLTVAFPKMKSLTGDLTGAELKKFLAENSEAAFYYSRVLTSRFFITEEFPQFFGMMDALSGDEWTVLEAGDEAFPGTVEL